MTIWRVWIETKPVPAETWSEQLDRLLEALEQDPQALGPVGWGTGTTLGAVFEIEADDVNRAAVVGLKSFIEALEAATGDAGYSSIRRMEISEADFEPLDLLGASDVARVLGVSRQRVYQLLNSFSDFPRPTTRLARGAVWNRREVEAWRDVHRMPVPYLAELVMSVHVAPPRVRIPTSEQRNRFIHSITQLGTRHGIMSEARWLNERECWVRFGLDAVRSREVRESAADLVRRRAQFEAQIALAEDIDVRFVNVESVAALQEASTSS